MVPKTGSRHSEGPISRFRFGGENVGRSFAMCSHDQFFRTNKESSIWLKMIMQNLLVPFIFQGECRMKIEHVLFSSVLFKIQDHFYGRSFLMCLHDPLFQTNKTCILKNGSCEQALKIIKSCNFA